MNKQFLSVAALLGALSVILGAFAAHKLKEITAPTGPETIAIFETGVRYQFYHVFALLIVALLSEKFDNKWMHWAGNCFITGIILFCGSLYVLTALRIAESTHLTLAGILTPVGGLFFIAGWIFLFLGVLKGEE